MGKAELIAGQREILKGVDSPTLRALGVIPIDQWQVRQDNEDAFERLLREYIENPNVNGLPKYRCGGIVNLCTTLRQLCEAKANEAEEAHQRGEGDWQFAADEFRELEKLLDLPYSTEVSDRDWDAGADRE